METSRQERGRRLRGTCPEVTLAPARPAAPRPCVASPSHPLPENPTQLLNAGKLGTALHSIPRVSWAALFQSHSRHLWPRPRHPD